MPVVKYEHQIEYAYDLDGRRFPRLSFEMSGREAPDVTIDVEAYLDSGAERSLFSGLIAAALGIDLFAGEELICQATTGSRLVAMVHPIRLYHPELGVFELEAGFSTTEIHRNLLGRDFFSLVQVGFREKHFCLYISHSP